LIYPKKEAFEGIFSYGFDNFCILLNKLEFSHHGDVD